MKKLLHTSLAGVLIGCAFPVIAASTAELAVKGMIVPSACELSLSAKTVEVGRISVKDLNQDTRTLLTPTTLTLGINCDAPTLFAMKATDNRSDSSITVSEFGVGKTATGEHIGGYILLLDNAIADTATVLPIYSIDNGTTWARQWNDDAWATTMLLSIKAADGASIPILAKDTQMELSVNPFINPAKNVPIGQDTQIDGSATITVMYL